MQLPATRHSQHSSSSDSIPHWLDSNAIAVPMATAAKNCRTITRVARNWLSALCFQDATSVHERLNHVVRIPFVLLRIPLADAQLATQLTLQFRPGPIICVRELNVDRVQGALDRSHVWYSDRTKYNRFCPLGCGVEVKRSGVPLHKATECRYAFFRGMRGLWCARENFPYGGASRGDGCHSRQHPGKA